jgi:hypothetical protein
VATGARLPVAELRPATAGHGGDAGGGALDQPAARRVRRRRGRAAVHEPPGLRRASLLRGAARAGGVGALLRPPRRRHAAVRELRAARLARGRDRENCNDWSIGIELEGLEGQGFEAAQYRQLATLLRALAGRYPIEEVVGHEDVAPGRKADPGPGFDWAGLQRALRRRRPRLPRTGAGRP